MTVNLALVFKSIGEVNIHEAIKDKVTRENYTLKMILILFHKKKKKKRLDMIQK